jgi:Ca2+-binding EF-hand superfamily protein
LQGIRQSLTGCLQGDHTVRLTPLRLAALFCFAALVLGPGSALTQFRGGAPGGNTPGGAPGGAPGGGAPGGGFQGGKGGFDPSMFASKAFDKYANGRDTLVIAEVQSSRDPQMQEKMQAWAATKGITNGQLTRDQFADYFKDQFAQGGFGKTRGGSGGGPGGPPGGPGGHPGGPGGAEQPRDVENDAENSFRRHDKNNDGVLSQEELPETLKAEWQKWDANKNGVIELDEYKEYYKARMQFLRGDKGNGDQNSKNPDHPNGQIQEQPQEEDKRPTVYRFGNLPKELPAWFSQLDTDRDGQVGLYEWKKGNRDIREFQAMDRNGDGFLTVEEVLRYQKVQAALKKNNDPTAGVPSEDGDSTGSGDSTTSDGLTKPPPPPNMTTPPGFGPRDKTDKGGFSRRGPGGGSTPRDPNSDSRGGRQPKNKGGNG